jgi:CheY-like chemotaxis protein
MDLDFRTRNPQIQQLKGLAILLVDDSPDYTKMMELRLKKYGAEIEVVNSGFKALDLVRARNFDVILMDIQMPGMDGLKTIKAMREHGVRCPIITVTALKDIVKLSPAQTADIAAHAGKPTDVPDLVETILGVIAIRDL